MNVPSTPSTGKPFRTPSLDAWRRELRAGLRTKYTFDAVWRAACRDADALEWLGMNVPQLAESCQQDALRVLKDAIRDEADKKRGTP